MHSPYHYDCIYRILTSIEIIEWFERFLIYGRKSFNSNSSYSFANETTWEAGNYVLKKVPDPEMSLEVLLLHTFKAYSKLSTAGLKVIVWTSSDSAAICLTLMQPQKTKEYAFEHQSKTLLGNMMCHANDQMKMWVTK